MADIILLDGRGEPTTYSGINVVEFDTPTGGRAQFIGGESVSKEVAADFSKGNQVITRDDGTILEKVTVRKPETLVPENISNGVEIAGVVGTATGGITPEIGFVPNEWDSDGFAVDGIWYGESIPNFAFYNGDTSAKTWKLQNVSFDGELKTIGRYAFASCTNLALTSLPESLVSIQERAFYATEIAITEIPASVVSIATYAFLSCGRIERLLFLGTPNSISSAAFDSCTNLKEIQVPWNEGAVAGAPWGAVNAHIEYNCFAPKYAITLVSSGDGVVEGESIANEGSAYTAKIIPDSGNAVSAVTDNGENVLSRVDNVYADFAYKVATADGASYGFELKDDGFYESTNRGVANSASVSVVTFNLLEAKRITIEFINYGEAGYDYGLFSNIDTTLTVNSTADTANVNINCKNYPSNSNVIKATYDFPAGEHFIYVKYRKDSGGDSGNDSLRFRVLQNIVTEGPQAVYVYSKYTVENVQEDHVIDVTFAPAT